MPEALPQSDWLSCNAVWQILDVVIPQVIAFVFNAGIADRTGG